MSVLYKIETIGNKLPTPASLFVIGLFIILCLSHIGHILSWSVTAPNGEVINTSSLLIPEGVWWLLSNLVGNFMKFPPLGIVLVGMLGIGLAEKSGLLPSFLRLLMQNLPSTVLTPMTIFIGIISSMALDAGYVVVPPLAAMLYQTAGRSPLAGIAAAFAGVSAGFSANLIITALDPLLAGLTQSAAQFIDTNYIVAVTGNLYLMMVSTVLLTLIGWFVSLRFVEPAVQHYQCNDLTAVKTDNSKNVNKALLLSFISLLVLLIIIFACVFIPDAPLFGEGKRFARWIEATVPLLFLCFFIPAIVFGITSGSIKSDKDVMRMMSETISDMGSYIVLAFFAAQFIECFNYSGLGKMLAITGGQALASLDMHHSVLLIAFIIMAGIANLFIGSASAKYAFFAPVFVPMLMQVGISPELTQASYRIGDSFSNVITPLNPYMIIILALVQRYLPKSGVGTIVAMMLPYSIAFFLSWSILLVIWLAIGWPLGPGGELFYARF